jgi:hypothetical protein
MGPSRWRFAEEPQCQLPRRDSQAEDLGITINALAIKTEVPDLDQWYRTWLITGPGAFVMDVEGFESFAQRN